MIMTAKITNTPIRKPSEIMTPVLELNNCKASFKKMNDEGFCVLTFFIENIKKLLYRGVHKNDMR